MSEDPKTLEERATLLKHIANSALPEAHLAPWMTNFERRVCHDAAGLETIAGMIEWLEKLKWNLAKNGSVPANGSEKKKEEDFDPDQTSGALAAYMEFARQYTRNLRDYMPSHGGLRTKQAMSLGMSQKMGVAVEPKPRTFLEKVTGRGKEKTQISGME